MYAPLGFKEVSRTHVVKLQAGDTECRQIWNLLWYELHIFIDGPIISISSFLSCHISLMILED